MTRPRGFVVAVAAVVVVGLVSGVTLFRSPGEMGPRTAFERGLAWYQANTGVPAGTTLTGSSGFTVTTPGAVLEGLDVTGDITVRADDVTIRNSRIVGVIHNEARNLLVEHVEMDGRNIPTATRETYAAISYGNYTLRYAKVHDYAQGAKAVDNTTVEDSLIYGLRSSGQHAEPILSNHGDGMTFRRNWLDSTWTNAMYHVSGALAMYGDDAQIRNVIVDGNHMLGSGYLTYTGAVNGKAYPVPYNVAYTNNTFDLSGPECYGPVAPGPMDALSVSKWNNNKTTTGQTINPPR